MIYWEAIYRNGEKVTSHDMPSHLLNRRQLVDFKLKDDKRTLIHIFHFDERGFFFYRRRTEMPYQHVIHLVGMVFNGKQQALIYDETWDSIEPKHLYGDDKIELTPEEIKQREEINGSTSRHNRCVGRYSWLNTVWMEQSYCIR